MLDKFPMDQIGEKTLMLPNMIKICKQNGNQEMNRYPQKTHAPFPMSEFKCKKVPNISDRNKQRN